MPQAAPSSFSGCKYFQWKLHLVILLEMPTLQGKEALETCMCPSVCLFPHHPDAILSKLAAGGTPVVCRERRPFLVGLQRAHPRKENNCNRNPELFCFHAVQQHLSEPGDHSFALRKAKNLSLSHFQYLGESVEREEGECCEWIFPCECLSSALGKEPLLSWVTQCVAGPRAVLSPLWLPHEGYAALTHPICSFPCKPVLCASLTVVQSHLWDQLLGPGEV